jgi:hypothetical protein
VADILLESVPFSLGLITDQQFYTLCAEVLIDFCSKTGLGKHLYNQQIDYGVGQYLEPSMLSTLQGSMAAQNFLYESSDWFLSNSDRTWQRLDNIGLPSEYRQDAIPPKTVQIAPLPQFQGNDVAVAYGAGGYGIISQVLSYSDFTITCDVSTPAGYGVVCGANGNPFLDAPNPGYGVFADLVPSTNNLTLMGTASPYQIENIGPQTYVEIVPDSFTPYLKYGILARIFGADSELRDLQKSAYCHSRYSEGTSIVGAIMCDAFQESAES